jgi:hypothetical protein
MQLLLESMLITIHLYTGSFNSVRNIMIDDVARQLVQKQAPSFDVDPKASASEAYGKYDATKNRR